MQIKSVNDSPLLTSGEAATYLRMSRTTLYRLTSHGAIKPVFIGTKTPYYLRSHLDEYINECVENG
jgi:excisionase family DNA binding protein